MNHDHEQNTQRLVRGSIRKIELSSTIMGLVRKLYLYLPPSYYEQPAQRYPVLYMHFGQHLFDPRKPGRESWRVHQTIERLLDADLMDEIIVVGIAAEGATVASEYWHYAALFKEHSPKGHIYESFILQEVKPFIDQNFRTLSDRDNTAMIGACAGAVASYNIAERNPDIFGKVGMLSPAVRSLDSDTWVYQLPLKKPPFLLWVDVGNAEGIYTRLTREFVDLLLAQGCKPHIDLFYYVELNGVHRDASWGARMINPLLLFFGKIGKPVSAELHGDRVVGVSGKPALLNPIVYYDTGFRMTAVDGNYRVDNPQILSVEQSGYLSGLCEGTTTVLFCYQGVGSSRNYRVVPSLPDVVQVRLRAYVPEETPEVEHINFGTLSLQRIGTKLYEGQYTLPRGFTLADSFTCGMRNFELQQDGTPIPLRLLRANEDIEIEYTIERWSSL